MGGGGFDFREVKKLQKQMEQMDRDRDKFYEACVRELAARLLSKVIRRTPVGRAPKLDGIKTVKIKGLNGKNKAFLSRSGAILQKYWAGYQGGTLRRSWTMGEIQKIGDSYQIEVINPTEYASYVEYGHRQKPGRYVPALGKSLKKAWVPGKLMMTISEKQIRAATPAFLEKKLSEYLKGAFNAK